MAMSWIRFGVCGLILPGCMASASGSAHATYTYPGGMVRVSYDSSRVKRASLDRWMQLSPALSPYNRLLVPITVWQCLPEDRAYRSCEDRSQLYIENVDVNISKLQETERRLENIEVPQSLRPVAYYLLEKQKFALWRATTVRRYLATSDIRVLDASYADLPTQGCVELDDRKDIATRRRSVNALISDWYNCTWQLESKRIGAYPDPAWQNFLREMKLSETVTEESPD